MPPRVFVNMNKEMSVSFVCVVFSVTSYLCDSFEMSIISWGERESELVKNNYLPMWQIIYHSDLFLQKEKMTNWHNAYA